MNVMMAIAVSSFQRIYLTHFQNDKDIVCNERSKLKEILKCQIDGLDSNLNKVIKENEDYALMSDELKQRCEKLQNELEESLEANRQLNKSKVTLEQKFDQFKAESKQCLEAQKLRSIEFEEKFKTLELDNIRLTSRLDETVLELHQVNTNCSNLLRQVSHLVQNESLSFLLLTKLPWY